MHTDRDHASTRTVGSTQQQPIGSLAGSYIRSSHGECRYEERQQSICSSKTALALEARRSSTPPTGRCLAPISRYMGSFQWASMRDLLARCAPSRSGVPPASLHVMSPFPLFPFCRRQRQTLTQLARCSKGEHACLRRDNGPSLLITTPGWLTLQSFL